MIKGSANDPKGLIFEAYRIDNIQESECRTIFLDWALSLPMEEDTQSVLRQLVREYSELHPDHPMTQVMSEGLTTMDAPKRRGGWRSRNRKPH